MGSTRVLRLWSEQRGPDDCGVEIDGVRVSFAELELALDRASAIDVTGVPELCDAYEGQGGRYTTGDFSAWLEAQAVP